MNVDKAFEVENGIDVEGGPFYTGGPLSPVGQGLPDRTVYVQTIGSGVLVWQKFGVGDTASDWRLYPASGISFDPTGANTLTATNLQDAVFANDGAASTALNTPRFAIPLQYNGNVGDATFFGYSNLLPGDATPIVIPIKSELFEFSFSNSKSTADYTLEFRKNSTTGSVLYTVSKSNVQFFADVAISINFEVGDTVYVKYLDDGTNASDVGLVLFFKAIP